MTGIVDEFARKYHGAIAQSRTLNKEGCRVPLDNLSCSYVVIDMDKRGSPLSRQETRCDFLFISENQNGPCIFAPLEFKKGVLDARKVVDQLQSCASLLEDQSGFTKNIKLLPIAVSGQNPKIQLRKFEQANYHILFNGNPVKISHMRCGARLANILEKYLV